MVQCDDCKGKGEILTFGNMKTCTTCKGDGELVVCESFSLSPTAVFGFRNQKCHNCGVRQNLHNDAEVTA